MSYIGGQADIIIIGGGHAGVEAALAAARLGCTTLCFTTSLDFIGNMPCNPSIGGAGKSQLVSELDALGGEMGRAADACCVQYRKLNKSKGPAVHSLRTQADRQSYSRYMKEVLEHTKGLTLRQGEVSKILVEGGRVCGVETTSGAVYNARAVVMCCGTFLGGRTFVGDVSRDSGPDGMFPANALTQSLAALGLPLRRFKTGTPPRVDAKTVDFTRCQPQFGDDDAASFSDPATPLYNKEVCWLTYTNQDTHEIIRGSLHRSPLYGGEITGIGPRYCPSIEDKVVRFSEKPRHQIFLEPCGKDSQELYVGGLSTSLPEDVQVAMLRTVSGLEQAEIMRFGYAIEYDCLDPTCLAPTMAVKSVLGLYAAGQICSTSGYEEAAVLGLIAGINAVHFITEKPPFIVQRSEGYIGVLIDDIVTKGTLEPYRMMTSRSEHRLYHRQDNSRERLRYKGAEVGLVSPAQLGAQQAQEAQVEQVIAALLSTYVSPTTINPVLEGIGSQPISDGSSLHSLLKRPEVSLAPLLPLLGITIDSVKTIEQVEISVKYQGYLKRQERELETHKKWEGYTIPLDIDYDTLSLLRTEARQKLQAIRPLSLGQAARISGVSPADISALILHFGKGDTNA